MRAEMLAGYAPATELPDPVPAEVPRPVETWPIIEREPEHEPVVPPDLRSPALSDDARDDWDDEWACTHCGGDGLCWDGADPLSGACPDEPHPCHACNGTGNRKDQVIF